jgi:hypothetical protein
MKDDIVVRKLRELLTSGRDIKFRLVVFHSGWKRKRRVMQRLKTVDVNAPKIKSVGPRCWCDMGKFLFEELGELQRAVSR